MIATRAYNEIVDFISAGPSPLEIVDFRPSEATRQRVLDLLFREKNAEISAAEKSELEHFLFLEHLMRLTKARARHHDRVNEK